jgi:hypothetical protein
MKYVLRFRVTQVFTVTVLNARLVHQIASAVLTLFRRLSPSFEISPRRTNDKILGLILGLEMNFGLLCVSLMGV